MVGVFHSGTLSSPVTNNIPVKTLQTTLGTLAMRAVARRALIFGESMWDELILRLGGETPPPRYQPFLLPVMKVQWTPEMPTPQQFGPSENMMKR